VSGEPVTFVGEAMVRVVQAVDVVAKLTGERPVVVGGLAVMCRLSRAHRATVDLDVVDRLSSSREPHLEVLRRGEGTESVEPSAVLVPTESGMVKVDVLEVRQTELDNPSEDAGDRLHATSHAWAQESATELSIRATASSGEIVVEVIPLVAEPGALVAMKLQAIMNRSNAKEAADLLDILRLTLDPGSSPAVLAQLASCDAGIAADIGRHAEYWFGERRTWAFDRIRVAGDTGLTIDDLELVRDLLVAACERP
jgi:hypothetical protein